MKNPWFRKAMCLVLSVTLLLGSVAIFAGADESSTPKGDESTAATLEDMQALVGTMSYDDYLASYAGDEYVSGPAEIVIPATENYVHNKSKSEEIANDSALRVDMNEDCTASYREDQTKWASFDWDANASSSLYLPTSGSVSWNFRVEDTAKGFYFIKIEYYNPDTAESSISGTERKLKIDGNVPFSESATLTFPKSWVFDYYDDEEGDAQLVSKSVEDVPGVQDDYDISYELKDDGYYRTVVTIEDGKKTTEISRITQDINGNSMAPAMQQAPEWSTYYCHDTSGYYTGYFQYYFTNGDHTITLEAEREPMIVRSISLVPISDEASSLPSYAEYQAQYADKTAPQNGKMIIMEAEYPDAVSDSSVYATNDNTSAVTSPVVSKAQLYNVIGENSYNTVGQWAAYKFRVTESGMYKFAMRFKQDALQGMYVCRTIKLSGGDYGLDGMPSAPFAEAYNCQYNYSKKWQSSFIGDMVYEGDEQVLRPFEFYFEEGVEYTVYFECSLGTLKELIQRVENSLDEINDDYLKILQLTGSDADEYRDYNFLSIMPEVLVSLLEQAIELEDVKAEFEELCGTNGSHITTLDTIAQLLDKMGSDDGDYIAANMSNLKSYLGTLGTWINNSKRSSIMVDSIMVCPADTDSDELPRAEAGFFRSAWFEFSSFIYSFFTDYDQMGLTTVPDEDDEPVEVWLATGRDQSSIWRSLIDAANGYTESTGVPVTLKLVTGGTLLPSILSRKGPDVYMGLGASDVINYAIREAVIGVSGNDTRLSDEENAVFNTTYYTYYDKTTEEHTTTTEKRSETASFVTNSFKDVIGDANGDGLLTEADGSSPNFMQAAMDTISLCGVTYGIPQTMSFAMMFYRMDVLASLGEEVPQTWSQLLALLPVLQTNNMSIGLSYGSAIDFMLYQRGGNMWKYTDSTKYDSAYAGSKIGLSENVALEAFEYTCRLYTDYSFPVSYDAANRFRTGEMPIIIGDYAGIYNQLVVYATEIDGLWEFCSLPGTEYYDDNGNYVFNYDSLAGVSATVMLNGCRGEQVRKAWQFMQWQTSAEVQASYGNKMVALIGPSAKYESANIKALEDLSWTSTEKAAIKSQMSHLSSVVNYPGSYIIGRYTKFAFLAAVNDGENPIEALSQYFDTINDEIKRKRDEFDLKTAETDEEALLENN